MKENEKNKSKLISDEEMVRFNANYEKKLADEILETDIGKKIKFFQKFKIGISIDLIVEKYLEENGQTMDAKGMLVLDTTSLNDIFEDRAASASKRLGFDILSMTNETELEKMIVDLEFRNQVLTQYYDETTGNSYIFQQDIGNSNKDTSAKNTENNAVTTDMNNLFDIPYYLSDDASNLDYLDGLMQDLGINSKEEQDKFMTDIANEDTSEEAIDKKTEQMVNFFDSLDSYTKAEIEQILKRGYINTEDDVEFDLLLLETQKSGTYTEEELKKFDKFKDTDRYKESFGEGVTKESIEQEIYKTDQARRKFKAFETIATFDFDGFKEGNFNRQIELEEIIAAALFIDNPSEDFLKIFKNFALKLKDKTGLDIYDSQKGINKEKALDFIKERHPKEDPERRLRDSFRCRTGFTERVVKGAQKNILSNFKEGEKNCDLRDILRNAAKTISKGKADNTKRIQYGIYEKNIISNLIEPNGVLKVSTKQLLKLYEHYLKKELNKEELTIKDYNTASMKGENISAILKRFIVENKDKLDGDLGKHINSEGDISTEIVEVIKSADVVFDNPLDQIKAINKIKRNEYDSIVYNQKRIDNTRKLIGEGKSLDEIYESLEGMSERILPTDIIRTLKERDLERFQERYGKSINSKERKIEIGSNNLGLTKVFKNVKRYLQVRSLFDDKEIREHYRAVIRNKIIEGINDAVNKSGKSEKLNNFFKKHCKQVKPLEDDISELVQVNDDLKAMKKVRKALKGQKILESAMLSSGGIRYNSAKSDEAYYRYFDNYGNPYTVVDYNDVDQKCFELSKQKKGIIAEREVNFERKKYDKDDNGISNDERISKLNGKIEKSKENSGRRKRLEAKRNRIELENEKYVEKIEELQNSTLPKNVGRKLKKLKKEAKKEAKKEMNLRLNGGNVSQKKLPESTARASEQNQTITSNKDKNNILSQHYEVDEKKAIEASSRSNTDSQQRADEETEKV